MRHDFDDEALRTALHDAYATIVPSGELDDFQQRVRAAAARRRVIRRAGGLAGAVTVAGAMWASMAVAGGASHQPAPAGFAPACPAAPFSAQPGGTPLRPGTGVSLVPGEPRIAEFCDFKTVFTTTPSGDSSTTTLVRSGSLTGDRLTKVLAAARSAFSPGLPRCPATPSSEALVLVFGYDSGPDVPVYVGVGGCPVIGNGTLSGLYQPRQQALSALVSG